MTNNLRPGERLDDLNDTATTEIYTLSPPDALLIMNFTPLGPNEIYTHRLLDSSISMNGTPLGL